MSAIRNRPEGMTASKEKASRQSMNIDTLQVVEQLTRVSRRAHKFRSALDDLLYLLPEAHGTWHDMAQETRRIELRLETLLIIIEEILGHDPEVWASRMLTPEQRLDEPLREV